MKADLRSFWRLVRPHALPRLPELALVALLASVASLAMTSALVLVEPLWFDVLFPGQQSPLPAAKEQRALFDWAVAGVRDLAQGFASAAGAEPRWAMLIVVAIALIALGVVSAVADYGFTWFGRRVALRMVVDLRLRLARHLMSLSMRYHGRRRFGDLLSRVSGDVATTLQGINVGLKDLIEEPIHIAITLGFAFSYAPDLTLSVVLALPVVALPLSILVRRVRKRSTKSLDSLGASVQALAQMFQGIRTVKAFRAEERELARYRELNEGFLRSSMRMVRAVAMTHAWSTFASLAGMSALVFAVGWFVLRGSSITAGSDLFVCVLALAQAANRLKTLTKAATRVQESVGAADRLLQVLEEAPDVVERPDPARLRELGAGLRFDSVGLTYPGSDEAAVSGLTLEVRRGETLAIVGPSGAGKSTLLDLACRFVDPTEGRVRVDGHDLRDVSLDDWTALYARVDQAPFLFHASIAENIGYGRPDASQAEIEEAARAAGIHEFVQALPKGYETDVADMGSRLSGGQRQRVAIARAFLKGAPLLILDEATSNLDSESEAQVQASLDRLMGGRTVVVVAHRLSTVRRANRIAVVDGGRLVDVGTHDELLARGGVYAKLVALQQLGGPVAVAE